MKLPFPESEKSKWRWMQILNKGETLHRVKSYDYSDEDFGVGLVNVETVCGKSAYRMIMPGMFSRLGAPRCVECCQRLGIKEGDGIPLNAKIEDPMEYEDAMTRQNLEPPSDEDLHKRAYGCIDLVADALGRQDMDQVLNGIVRQLKTLLRKEREQLASFIESEACELTHNEIAAWILKRSNND